ncbi:major facilitator superfamily MFS_1 [Methylobacterium sp. 4-46]|uniref:MFS transporter n=2 Tax=Methylobacterium TaxID=407 RepID=UPI000152CD72|nr:MULTISPECIES: MFS transporter [Methylobacterium]ACA14638.1 major facilitator superfamily MFS_1 [Methylobacterium sp. 4-46]WFT80391.1 MFS transporter [Methylobacterium nodulans]
MAAGATTTLADEAVRTDIPARMDRLPWSRFHLLLVIALGITWVLDGLEVTIVGAIGPVLQDPRALGLSVQEIGAAASFYVVGAVAGALVFGWVTDRYGRRVVFFTTLVVYVGGVVASALAWNFWSFALFRLVTGLGIGGEYAAINSAIDELIPAKYRGRVDLIVNGSFWVGAAAGAAGSLLLLDPDIVAPHLGWRLGFGIGGVLGLFILVLRRYVPESPRWLVVHGRQEEAERTVAEIERKVEAETGAPLAEPDGILEVHPKASFGFGEIFGSMLGPHRGRSLLALVLMSAQAFLFNAVFFTYGLVLAKFYGIPETGAGLFLVPLAIGNFLGPLLLGHYFDTIGRRRMITGTFAVSGLMLAVTALVFGLDLFTAWTQTFAWIAIFFVASAAASSAYLTASEIFPLETRALAIAVFYALGTAAGGVMAPWLFTRLIESGHHAALAAGYGGAALLLLVAALTEWKLGVDAEGKSLESIAAPLSKAR